MTQKSLPTLTAEEPLENSALYSQAIGQFEKAR